MYSNIKIMKPISKISVVLLFLALVASSCGKYEDGPSISLMPKTARLINTWKLDAEYKNDVQQELTADDKDDYFEIKKDGILEVTIVNGSTSVTYTGTWELSSDKEKLHSVYSTTVFGLTYTTDEESTILRLKSNELWIERVEGNDTYEYHYITK